MPKGRRDGPHGWLIMNDLCGTVKPVTLPHDTGEQDLFLQEHVAGGEGRGWECFSSPCKRFVFYGAADTRGERSNVNPFLEYLLGEGHTVAGSVFVFKYSEDVHSDGRGGYAHENPDTPPTIIYYNGPVPPSPPVPPPDFGKMERDKHGCE